MFFIQILAILLFSFTHFNNEVKAQVNDVFITSQVYFQNSEETLPKLDVALTEADGEEEVHEYDFLPSNDTSQIFTGTKLPAHHSAPLKYVKNKNAWRFAFVPKFILHQSYLI